MYPASARILILHDMATMRKYVANRFRSLGYDDLHEAKHGIEGWELICSAEREFDLIVADWYMPLCTGIELYQKIINERAHLMARFIFHADDIGIRQIEKQIGSTPYISIGNPLTAEGLLGAIKVTCGKLAG
jgi:CheY-like chemotaxis protein